MSKIRSRGWYQECREAANGLSPLVCQSILDDVNNGKQLGDIARSHGVTLEAVCGVVDRNIRSRSYLETTDRGDTL